MGKKTTLTLIFLGLLILVNGQNVDSVSYTFRLNGLGTISQKISFLSPIKYTGVNTSYDWGRFRQINNKFLTKNLYFNFALTFNGNDQNTNIENPEERPIPLGIYSFNYGYLFNKRYSILHNHLPKKAPLISLGWSYWLDAGLDIKPFNVNNPFYYNLNNMAGLSLGLKKRVNIKKVQLDISNEFTLPLFGIYAATRYSSSLPYSTIVDDTSFWDAFQIGSFQTNFQFRNNLNLDFTIPGKKKNVKHTFRFQYGINYANLRVNNNQKIQATHIFKLGYLFNSSRYVHK